MNLVRTATDHPAGIAIRLDDVTLTYAELERGARKVARVLADRGVGVGDRVGIMLPNVPHFALLYYGVLRAGGVVVPMNPLLKRREVAFYLSNSGAQLVFAWPEFAAEAAAGARRAGAEVVAVEPGAELTHANLLDNVDVAAETVLRVGPDDAIFAGLPLFHVFGQTCVLNLAVRAGVALTLVRRFDATTALEVMARDRVTIFEGVPTMYAALLHHPARAGYDLESLELCVSGGSSMPVEVLTAFERAFGCVVLEGYGLSPVNRLSATPSLD